jgi:hypothetical protein
MWMAPRGVLPRDFGANSHISSRRKSPDAHDESGPHGKWIAAVETYPTARAVPVASLSYRAEQRLAAGLPCRGRAIALV